MGSDHSDTKQKLIDTALELLWQSSYGSVSVDDICKAAGVKKGSFYHFFPSKIDLTIAAMEENSRLMKINYDSIFSAGIDPLSRFVKLAEFIYDYQAKAADQYGHVCGCPCASLGSETAGHEERIQQKFESVSHLQERYYENALRDMVAEGMLPATTDVKVKAQEIYSYLLGQMMLARIQNNLEPLKRDLKAGLLRTLGVTSEAL